MPTRISKAQLQRMVNRAVAAQTNRECHRKFGQLAIPENCRIVSGGLVYGKDEGDERNDDDGHLHHPPTPDPTDGQR
jgi:hypothetical protein